MARATSVSTRSTTYFRSRWGYALPTSTRADATREKGAGSCSIRLTSLPFNGTRGPTRAVGNHCTCMCCSIVVTRCVMSTHLSSSLIRRKSNGRNARLVHLCQCRSRRNAGYAKDFVPNYVTCGMYMLNRTERIVLQKQYYIYRCSQLRYRTIPHKALRVNWLT